MLIALLLLSFVVGILACLPLAKWISPPPVSLLFILFTPWTLLSFFSQYPLIRDFSSMYLSFILGMCAYWTYFETAKKMKNKRK